MTEQAENNTPEELQDMIRMFLSTMDQLSAASVWVSNNDPEREPSYEGAVEEMMAAIAIANSVIVRKVESLIQELVEKKIVSETWLHSERGEEVHKTEQPDIPWHESFHYPTQDRIFWPKESMQQELDAIDKDVTERRAAVLTKHFKDTDEQKRYHVYIGQILAYENIDIHKLMEIANRCVCGFIENAFAYDIAEKMYFDIERFSPTLRKEKKP